MTSDHTSDRIHESTVLKECAQIASKTEAGLIAKLWVDSSKLRAYITVQMTQDIFSKEKRLFEDILSQAKISVTDDARESLFDYINSRDDYPQEIDSDASRLEPFLIAEGIAPAHGNDGYAEFHIDLPGESFQKLGASKASTVKIDHRERRQVISISAEDHVADVYAPTKGQPGADIYGNPIPARSGEPAAVRIGKGIVKDESEKGVMRCRAEHDGCVKWDGRNLSIEPFLHIKGDVDYSVGNVDFAGSILVDGNVLEGFRVNARDSLEVKGFAEKCVLEAGMNIKVHGGITGGGTAHLIKTKAGNIEAKYILNATVDSGGDLTADTQITNSNVTAFGIISVKNGPIIGGESMALGGFDLYSAGSNQGTRTRLLITAEKFRNEEMRELNSGVARLQEKLEQINMRVGPLIADPAKLGALDEKKKAIVMQLIEQSEKMEQELDTWIERRNEVIKDFNSRIGNRIIIRQNLFPGNDIQIDQCRQVVEHPLKGPLVLKPNFGTGTLSISAYRE
ncbi:MAG: FapA family protein [Planctomycetes bacterium]|nr:FapA family protein [Planctomycetota bacterium]